MRLVEPLNAAERAALVAHARSFVGVPFKHRGRSRDGIDCVGLGQECLHAISRGTVDDLTYERLPRHLPAEMEESRFSQLREAVVSHLGPPLWERVSVKQPLPVLQAGDLVAMRWTGNPSHVALIGDGLTVIHALAEAKRVVETRLADPWPRRIVGVWRP